MVKIKFIKDHPAGIKEGRIINASKNDTDRWIMQGYAKEATLNVSDPYFKKITKTDLERNEELKGTDLLIGDEYLYSKETKAFIKDEYGNFKIKE